VSTFHQLTTSLWTADEPENTAIRVEVKLLREKAIKG
jgi:hypothetical protein